MFTYADEHEGRYPPAAVYGKDGQPLLSWRVLLLPYIEERALFEEFHLDEPWDSDHNRTLLKRMPRVYRRPQPWAEDDATIYQVFVGPGSIFETREPPTLGMVTSADGTSNTLLIVEAGEPVPWTKPADLVFTADQPLPALGGLFRDDRRFRPFARDLASYVFQAAWADGHVSIIPNTAVEQPRFRAWITWNGNEKEPPP